MNDVLKDAYGKYKALGFILQKSVKNKKFSVKEGVYEKRENENWDDKATGYVAIVPKNLIVIDADTYVDGCQFEELVKKLQLTTMPEPSVVTPSGGLHYIFENKYPEMVIGNHGFKGVDIYAGFQSVIPIVGTTVLNKQKELNQYRWDENSFDSLVINSWEEIMLDVLCMRDRVNVDSDFTDNNDDGLFEAIKNEQMPFEEVVELCKQIPIEIYGWDTGWLKFGMAMYDRFCGSEQGLKLFQKTCTRYSDNHPDLNERKWRNGNFKSNGQITYKTLKSLANEGKILEVFKTLNDAEDVEELESLADDLQSQRLNTTIKKDDTVRNEILEALCVKSKELTGKPDKVKWKKVVKFVEPETELEKSTEFDIYRLNNKYLLRIGNKIISDISPTMLKEILASYGYHYSKEEFPKLKMNIKTISDYQRVPDYTINTHLHFGLEKQKGVSVDAFVIRFNPLHDLVESEVDEDIVKEFFEDVWAGKLYDIVKLMALTIKLKEQKLNRLMIIAPSNAGKSEIFTHLYFQKVTMARLLNGMRGDKGIGSDVVSGIRNSGLLLIDEANKALEAEIKDMDKELHIDQFGASGGTQILPLHFTALTSTHSNATRNNSDELYNRFLQIELSKNEMKHTVSEGELFRKDSSRYTDHVRVKLLSLFKEALESDEGINELRTLQEKYRLPLNTDLDELLFEISEDFIDETKSSARDSGNVVSHRGSYYYKRRGDIENYFNNKLGEIDALDVGKYSEKLVKHFVSQKSKSLKINGKPTKYYEVTLAPFTENEEQLITSIFDDLTLDDF